MREHEATSCWTGSLSADVTSFRVHVEEEILNINYQLPLLDGFISGSGDLEGGRLAGLDRIGHDLHPAHLHRVLLAPTAVVDVGGDRGGGEEEEAGGDGGEDEEALLARHGGLVDSLCRGCVRWEDLFVRERDLRGGIYKKEEELGRWGKR